ncbi:biliverdin-producing heme oxygenase [Porticoccus sp.]|uniref:biliverdin-producing heme oxygenase n=1 Tax=Porticoccus sp. TaxID=2024853 RepID=UPI000C68009F|nr:biliverdin-producing heme oxygenase [Porticoccus sp.]MAZ71451.1 hypothetical protein [Porticoccus sp.]|tara:strand:+ start:4323 stop:4994 length:672 start_codon:yes stop_codon:yes gene_type:complete
MSNLRQATQLTPATLLARLREGTRTEHAILERHPLLQPLISDPLEFQDYLKVLAALLAFYQQLEPLLEETLPVECQESGYRYLSRSVLLRADLEQLTGDRHSLDTDRVPLLPLPDLSSSDRVIGVLYVLYVLEGATQGGRVIAPRVARLLAGIELPMEKPALNGSDGVQYFQLFRHNEWAKLQRVIAQVSRRPHAAGETVAAAIETFRCLGGYLDYYLNRECH